MTGKEWIFSTKSVIPKSFPPSFQLKLRNEHGGQKPPELCESLIQAFTKKGQTVLDPFAGVGGTLIGCHLAKRRGTGIEKNEKWIEIYKEVCAREDVKLHEMIAGDSCKILEDFINEGRVFDFILTDIPYWKMDSVQKSKGTFKKVGEPAKGVFSDKSKLSKFSKEEGKNLGKDEWKDLINDIFEKCYRVLKPGKYCCVFIGNMYNNGKYHLLNADLATILEDIGYVLKGEIVWYDVSNNLHLYGINYSWIPSIVHQFIMVFRKEREEKLTAEQKKQIEEENLRKIDASLD